MAKRGGLTNAAWARLRPLLPLNGQRGGQWRDHRQVIDGILWRLRVGAPWRDVPARYGPQQTCYDRFVRWRRDGTWDRLLALVQATADAAGELDWAICIDATVVRAHQHAAGARRNPSKADRAAKAAYPTDEALGRSRGGRTTKLHLACDGRGRVLAVILTPGQRHESTQLGAVLDAIRVPRHGSRGRPRKRPAHVIADKGFRYPRCRRLLRRRGIAHTVPERRDQRARRLSRRGRPLAFDATRYRARSVVERCVGWLKQWRAVATRYDKRALNYHAAVVTAALLRWLPA
jgi:transposase